MREVVTHDLLQPGPRNRRQASNKSVGLMKEMFCNARHVRAADIHPPHEAYFVAQCMIAAVAAANVCGGAPCGRDVQNFVSSALSLAAAATEWGAFDAQYDFIELKTLDRTEATSGWLPGLKMITNVSRPTR